MKLSSHGFLFHRSITRSENKAQIPFTMRKNYESSVTMRKNNEYISDVQQKITELHKLEKWL